MKKYFFMSAMLLLGLTTSCQDQFVTDENGNNAANGVDEVYNIRLVDEAGNQVNSLNGEFTQLYVEVEAQGDWCLSTGNSNFVYLTTEVGHGNGRVPVFVSTCWAGSRDFSIKACPLSNYNPSGAPASRAADGSATTEPVTQTSEAQLEAVSNRLSSNLGVGYSLTIANTQTMVLKTQAQVINLVAMKERASKGDVLMLKDDMNPFTSQKYLQSDSKSAIVDQMTIGVDGKMGSGALKGSNISGDVTISDNSDSTSVYAVRRQLSTFYTREVNYLQAVFEDSLLLAPGFRMMRDTLENLVDRLVFKGSPTKQDSALAYSLIDEFFREVGANVCIKSSLGCALDYYMKVDSSSIKSGYSIKAVVDLKYESQVADTAQSAKTDSTKFSISGDADIVNEAKKVASNSEVEVVIAGGDTKSIDILCTGGRLVQADIQKWQQSIRPENAVLTEMVVTPITSFFRKPLVKNFVFNYMVELGLTTKKTADGTTIYTMPSIRITE